MSKTTTTNTSKPNTSNPKSTESVSDAAQTGPLFGHVIDMAALLSFKREMMPVSRLVFPDFDSRGSDEAALPEDFVESVRAGIIEPVVICPIAGTDRFMIIDGRRRVRGAIECGMTEVPYTMPPVTATIADGNNQDAFQRLMAAATIHANKHRKGLNDWDVAVTMKRLVDDGMPQKDVAAQWGVAPPYVSQHISLFKLDPAVQELLKKHANSQGAFSKARKLLEVTNPTVQREIAKDAFDVAKAFEVKDVDFVVDQFKAKLAAEEEKAAEKAAAAAAGAPAGKGGKETPAAGKDATPPAPAVDPYKDAKFVGINTARELLAAQAAKVSKMTRADGTDPAKLAYEKGREAGLKQALGLVPLPKSLTNQPDK
jgi:ParB/RepB/Spo0J family partition protein